MGISDDRLEFWFQLYGISSLVGLAVNVVSIGKLSHVCDKRAKMCGHPFAILPSIIPLTFAALAYLGLMISATFIHVDEGNPGSDDYYDDVNWIVYFVMLLAFIWPHLYTADYYSSRKWKKYIYSSYKYITGIANLLYWISLIIMTILMITAIVLTGIDGRWTTMGIYIAFTVLLMLASVYFTLEWYWCGGIFRKLNSYYRGSKTVVQVIEIMERNAEQAQHSGTSVSVTRKIRYEPHRNDPIREYHERKDW
ncbi:MAG: hypothetical protein ACTSUE_07260 [Promethearchaeota archaeon]